MKALVTGAKGMFGSDLCAILNPDYEVLGYDVDDFDIVEAEATVRAIVAASPDIVIHLAAFTDVEACEDEKDKAFKCNALGTFNVARAAREVGAYVVYLSTDYVFDGAKREPYKELDKPSPVNFYGLTKLYGEQYVRDLNPQHLVVRSSWLFGPNGKNFVDTIVAKASDGRPLKVVDDQTGCPTYTLDLARGMKRVIGMRLEGTIHITNCGEATWFGLAKYVVGLAGLETEIEPVETGEYPAKAKRPVYSVLGSLVAESSGLPPLPSWRDGVKHHLLRKGVIKGSEPN